MKQWLAELLRSQSNRPAAAIAIIFSAGIGLSQTFRDYVFCGFALAGFVLLMAAFLALRRRRRTAAFILGNAAIFLAGLMTALAHRDGIPDNHIRRLISRFEFALDEPALFDGCVVGDVERRSNDTGATVELRGIHKKNRWMACKGKGLLRIAGIDADADPPQAANLSQGDRVRGWAVWRRPGNFQNPGSADRAGLLARRGVFLTGRAKSPRLLEIVPGDCSNFATAASSGVRNLARRSFQSMDREGAGQSAAVLASLVIGDYSGLDNSTRELFQNAGAFHVLVVSGLHIAWIAGVLLFLFRLVCLPERIRYLLATLAILFYAAVVGYQASVARCLWMFILYLTGRMLIRRADPANLLFASALILLAVQPDWLLEIGFQLSFLSVMAIALTAAPAVEKYLRPLTDPLRHCGRANRLFPEPGLWPKAGRGLRVRCEMLVEGAADASFPAATGPLLGALRIIAWAVDASGAMLIASLSVQIWIEPLLACYFNRLSWIAPVANLAMVPFSSLVLSAGIISSLAAGIPYIGMNLLELAGRLASLLLACADWITKIDGAWQRCATPSVLCVEAGILAVFLWSFFRWRKLWIPFIYVFALLAFLALGWNPAETWRKAFSSGGRPILKIVFLDVGEGDSAVLSFPNGQHWIIDAGGLRQPPSGVENSSAFDIGEAVVSRYLWNEWVPRLDRAVLSHSDIDHAGGMPALINNFPVARLDFPRSSDDAILRAILGAAFKKNLSLHTPQSGMEEKIGEATVRVLNPPAGAALAGANDHSVVLHISYKYFSALFTGDLEKAGEAALLNCSLPMKSFLLKVSHHGSRSSTSDSFLDRFQPRWAVISCGRNNPFGHPSREVLERLLKRGAQPLLTLDQGAIVFETDGFFYTVRSHAGGEIQRPSPIGLQPPIAGE